MLNTHDMLSHIYRDIDPGHNLKTVGIPTYNHVYALSGQEEASLHMLLPLIPGHVPTFKDLAPGVHNMKTTEIPAIYPGIDLMVMTRQVYPCYYHDYHWFQGLSLPQGYSPSGQS